MATFVLRSMPRAGTHLLCSLLNSHPRLRVLGEVFGSHDLFFASVKSLPRDPLPNAGAALAAVRKCADGFAMHDYQSDYAWTGIDEELVRVPRLKVLWLERRDRFLQAVSAELAHQSQLWHRRPHERELPPGPYDVRLERLLQFARATAQWRCEARDRLAGTESLTLVYEEIVADPQRELDRAFKFLGVRTAPVAASCSPTRGDRGLHDYVPALESLQERFWAELNDGTASDVSGNSV